MKMNYHRHVSSSIGPKFSHKRNTGFRSFGLFIVIGALILLIVLFIVLRKPLANLLFGIRSLVVPDATTALTLSTGAFESQLSALEVENTELKNLLLRAGVRIPGDSVDSNIDTDFDNDNEPDQNSGESESVNSTGEFAVGESNTSSALAMSAKSAKIADENMQSRKVTLRDGDIVASVLVRPPQSPYDALIISAGTDHGVTVGDQVYAFTGFPIGEIISVGKKRATVRLFSAPGSKLEVLIGTSTLAVQAEGKGGGNFFLKLPRVTDIHPGDIVAMNYLPPEVFSSIESVDSTDGEAYIYAYFKLPVNINSLVYVLVKKNPAQ